MTWLRPLSEAECYERLYKDTERTVTVVRRVSLLSPRGRQVRLSGEELRRGFEERLDAREPELDDQEAA